MKLAKYLSFLLPGLVLSLGIATAVATAAGAESEASYQHGSKRMARGFGPHRLFKLLHRLDVNSDQRLAIGAAMDQHRPVMREFILDMMDGKSALHEILTSSDYDPIEIEEIALAQAKNTEYMFIATAKTFANISAVLTLEQRQELAQLIDRRWADRGERRRAHHSEHDRL